MHVHVHLVDLGKERLLRLAADRASEAVDAKVALEEVGLRDAAEMGLVRRDDAIVAVG